MTVHGTLKEVHDSHIKELDITGIGSQHNYVTLVIRTGEEPYFFDSGISVLHQEDICVHMQLIHDMIRINNTVRLTRLSNEYVVFSAFGRNYYLGRNHRVRSIAKSLINQPEQVCKMRKLKKSLHTLKIHYRILYSKNID